jgi:hypothetical protein
MIYTFQHPETGQVIDVSQNANDKHVYIDSDGLKWNRVFNIPYTSSNTKADPFSAKDFSNAFENKKVKIGDITDCSAEMSAKREQRLGSDPVKTKFFDDYSKKRRGINHPDDPRPKEAARKKAQEHIDKTFRLPAN